MERENYLKNLYKKLYHNYHVHFTPDFAYDPIKKIKYVYFNKPFGLKHWLEHADPPVGDEAIVCLVDPDFIFLRPFTSKVRGLAGLSPKLEDTELMDRVVEGKPVAAIYGLGAPWTVEGPNSMFKKHKICEPASPCLRTETAFAQRHYSVGPPYVAHRRDMQRIAAAWCRYAKPVHEQYPELLAEMYAYSIAAAHEQLPHLQLSNYMLSNIHMSERDEAWSLVDALPEVCSAPVAGLLSPQQPLPAFLHYCQVYRAGEMGWAKRRPQLLDIFSCESPLLLEPYEGLAALDYKLVAGKKIKISQRDIKRNTFAICVTHGAVNAAVEFFKSRMCEGKGPPNLNKTTRLDPVGG